MTRRESRTEGNSRAPSGCAMSKMRLPFRSPPIQSRPFLRMIYRPPTELKIFSGSAHNVLAQRIADYCKIKLGNATVSSFPDGETMVKINENIRGRDVFIVQPTCPPTNQNIMELLIMVD